MTQEKRSQKEPVIAKSKRRHSSATQLVGLMPNVKWWHWLVMYPTLFSYLLGSAYNLPTLFKAYAWDVPVAEVSAATKVRGNFLNIEDVDDCFDDLELNDVPGSDNATILVGVCPRKAVFVQIQPHDQSKKSVFRLIPLADFANESGTWPLVKEAVAAEVLRSFQVAQGGAKIICRKKLGGGRLRIRIQYPNGECFDQTINTYTGVVITSVPVPCDPRC